MPLPVSEQIAVIVKARLEAISTGSGYETTANGVIRKTKTNNDSPDDYQIYLEQGDKVRNDALSHPGNPPAVAKDLPFFIRGILRPSDELATPIDTLKNTFEADIEKAVKVAGSGYWAQMDGLAVNSSISGVEDYQSDDGAEGGFQVILTVTYRTDENNPYNVRA